MKLFNKPTSVLHEILDWSQEKCPDWQRDALRRIIQNEDILEKDLTELEIICRSKYLQQSEGTLPKALPLDETHISSSSGTSISVSLTEIGRIQHVNRLSYDSKIEFGNAPGLTVIYGENGVGKSGYARILKKACRTRGKSGSIKYDVFKPPPTEKPSAEIIYRVSNIDEPTSIIWKEDHPIDPYLTNIFVFDSKCAEHYIQNDEATSFTPFGLDILSKLSRVCDHIKERISREINFLTAENDRTKKVWARKPDSVAGKLVFNISHNSSIEDIKKNTELSKEENIRIKTIKDTLSADPVRKSKETRASKSRLERLATLIYNREQLLTANNISKINHLVVEVQTKSEIAQEFSSKKFDSTYLMGTGSDAWKLLWEKAREYSEREAYKEIIFPNVSEGSKCVLCQQDLDGNAKKRFAEFDKYYKDESQRLEKEAQKKFNESLKLLEKEDLLFPEIGNVEVDLGGISDFNIEEFKKSIQDIDTIFSELLQSLQACQVIDTLILPNTHLGEINAYALELEKKAQTEESSQDLTVKNRLQAELEDLESRQWVQGVMGQIEEQIERQKKIKLLENCLRDTNTTGITQKNKELTEKYVTQAYCDRFSDEVKSLGLQTIQIKIQPIKGAKGETKFGLKLEKSSERNIFEIASEGEQRCIALAAFLAELSQASHNSSLIFDDPVSSLDHNYQRHVANRLVDESKLRQVIVFTHDVIFLNDLETASTKKGGSVETRYLEWDKDSPGRCSDGLPWTLKSIPDRFDKIEKELKKLKSDWTPIPNEGNKAEIRHLYSELRATLESIIEKKILGDSLLRFRSYIDVKKLEALIGFSREEYQRLAKLMQKCHDTTDAHDMPSIKSSSLSTPDELANDIEDAKALVKDVEARIKKNKESRA